MALFPSSFHVICCLWRGLLRVSIAARLLDHSKHYRAILGEQGLTLCLIATPIKVMDQESFPLETQSF